jgi:hypothetical protein
VSWFDAAWHWYLANATVVGAVGAFATAATLAWAAVQNARTAARRHEEQTKDHRDRLGVQPTPTKRQRPHIWARNQ